MASEKIERGLVLVGVRRIGAVGSGPALGRPLRRGHRRRGAGRLRLALPGRGGRAAGGRGAGPVRHQTEEAGRRHLDDTIAQVYPPEARGEVEAQIVHGHPAQVLIDMSKEADLLVVGGSGHGAFTGMLIGSVSIHCVTGAFCPVTVVRGSEADAEAM